MRRRRLFHLRLVVSFMKRLLHCPLLKETLMLMMTVSADDLRVELHVLDYGAMNVGPWLVRTYPPICMNLRNAISIQTTVSEEKVMGL